MSARNSKATKGILDHYKLGNFFKEDLHSRQSSRALLGSKPESRAVSTVNAVKSRHKRFVSNDTKAPQLPVLDLKKKPKKNKLLEEKKEIYQNLLQKNSSKGGLSQRQERGSVLMQAPGSSFEPPRKVWENFKTTSKK